MHFFLFVLAGRTAFANFLKSEFSEENMDFWVTCDDYKKTAPSKLAAKAMQIYQQYVEADAPNEVITLQSMIKLVIKCQTIIELD